MEKHEVGRQKINDLMGDSSSGRNDVSMLILFDDCAANSIKTEANRSKSGNNTKQKKNKKLERKSRFTEMKRKK